MRPIKFRAWDKETKSWLHLNFGLGNLIDTALAYKSMELMQYTGLKDKNGKEIYEGDFIKLHNAEVPRGSVEWHDGSFVARWIGGKNFEVLYQRLTRHYEVIGNIYENPELLKPQYTGLNNLDHKI